MTAKIFGSPLAVRSKKSQLSVPSLHEKRLYEITALGQALASRAHGYSGTRPAYSRRMMAARYALAAPPHCLLSGRPVLSSISWSILSAISRQVRADASSPAVCASATCAAAYSGAFAPRRFMTSCAEAHRVQSFSCMGGPWMFAGTIALSATTIQQAGGLAHAIYEHVIPVLRERVLTGVLAVAPRNFPSRVIRVWPDARRDE